MSKKMSNLKFWAMKNIGMPIRNRMMPPGSLIDDVSIQEEDKVLDYGCDPGLYTKQLSEKVGSKGIVYALDNYPLAIKAVDKLAKKEGLINVETILSGGETNLNNEGIDTIIVFDVLHMISAPEKHLKEFNRVLKHGGMLYLSDHHMKIEEINEIVFKSCSMDLKKQTKYVLAFEKKRNKDGKEGS